MKEEIKLWLIDMYESEIEEMEKTISNCRIWERGYDGEDPNPYTENIATIDEYIDILREKIEELK